MKFSLIRKFSLKKNAIFHIPSLQIFSIVKQNSEMYNIKKIKKIIIKISNIKNI